MSDEKLDSVEQPSELTMLESIRKATIGLGLFAVVTAGLIAVTQQVTFERIEEQVKLAKSKALFEIVPAHEHDNALLAEAFMIEVPELGLSEPNEAYVAKLNGAVEALIFPVVVPDGYSGTIRLIMGISKDGAVKGVRVVSHQETPGLGDKIELNKSDWILEFDHKTLMSPEATGWNVKKDGGEFDQLTGATITPRSIVKAVHRALQFYDEHQTVLLNVKPGELVSDDTLSRSGRGNES